MSFKDKIKEIRTNSNKSQAEFAASLHTSQSSVAMWETGQRMPSRIMLEEIASKYNVSVDYLVDTGKYNPDLVISDAFSGISDLVIEQVQNTHQPNLAKEYTDLIIKYSKASKEIQQAINKILED